MVNRYRQSMMLAGLLSMIVGCGVDQKAAEQWQSRVSPPITPTFSAFQPRTADSPSDPGYNLYLCVDSTGIDFSTWPRFSQTIQNPPGGSKFDPSTGHSWVALQSPKRVRFRGQTGNEGVVVPEYSTQFTRLNKKGHPDPIIALLVAKPDGRSHDHPGRHDATFALRVPITKQQHAYLKTYLELFDYRRFSLVDNQCTDFVVQAAWYVGLTPSNRIQIELPNTAHIWGKNVRFWTDPRFGTITIGSPDILEQSLRKLAAQGLGEEATADLRALQDAAAPR